MREDAFSLINLKSGSFAKIISMGGGFGMRQKLSLRGIHVGSIIKVVNSYGGPVVVEANGNVIAIGRGMAQKILAQKVDSR